MEIKVTLAAEQADALFKELIARGTNLTPLMQDLGEYLTETTKQRFQTSTAPDGQKWKPNAQATYLAYLGAFKGSFGKTGKITKGGAGRAMGKKPLIGETRRLSSEIYYQADRQSVEIGSGLVYSAIHQFGGQAGRGLSVKIPARPFLGISSSDEAAITDMAGAYLAGL
jgi:phage virion morphogenesis protein